MNPFGSLPPLQWSSFTALIHRLFHDQQANLRLLKEQQDEEDKCRHITDKGEDKDKPVILPLCDHTSAMIDRCTQLCTRHGFVGGRCLPNYNEKSGCVCLLDEGERFGLLLKRENMTSLHLGEDATFKGCNSACRSLGAYSGFCDVTLDYPNSCYCAIPWHEGSIV